MLAVLATLLLAATVQAAVLTIQSPRLTVSDATGSQVRSELWAFSVLEIVLDLWFLRIRLSLTHKPSTPVQLGEADTLKVVFQIVDKDTGSGVQPHQTFLRFYDEKSKEEGIQPVRVTPGGKAKFDLVRALSPLFHPYSWNSHFLQNLRKPPTSLPPTPNSDPLKVSLIIGTPKYDPITVDLFDLVLPKSQPAPEHPLESTFHVLPEIKHTFRPDHKVPPTFISAAFTLIVLAPWAVLIGLVSSFFFFSITWLTTCW